MCCKTQAQYLFIYLFSFQPFIDQRLASLTGSFFKQSIFKQILTEGILVCVQLSGQKFCNIIMFTMIKPCLYFHCFFLSGEKYVMTVFGVLNFGDQGNTACVNIYMHVMSKTFLFFICFLPSITIFSTWRFFLYQWYKLYCCHAVRGRQSIICHSNK